jgi:hypothetical protein
MCRADIVANVLPGVAVSIWLVRLLVSAVPVSVFPLNVVQRSFER